MICMPGYPGAPDSVLAGSETLRASIADTPSRSVPETDETMCITCE